MTVTELLGKLSDRSTRNLVLAVMYFEEKYKHVAAQTSDELRKKLIGARVPKASSINVSDVLSKSGALVDSVLNGRKRIWTLTDTGRSHVETVAKLSNPVVASKRANLVSLANGIKDQQAKEYIAEAVKCLDASALRAAVVFAWEGAVHLIRQKVITYPLVDVNNAIKKHYNAAKTVSSADDLAYIKESTLLNACRDLGIFDKNQKDELENYCLDVRNKCGHPGQYNPGPDRVAAVLEDLIQIVFTRM